MKKILIIASATAAIVGAYFLIKRKTSKSVVEPAMQPNTSQNGNAGKHITDMFSRAKQHSLQ